MSLVFGNISIWDSDVKPHGEKMNKIKSRIIHKSDPAENTRTTWNFLGTGSLIMGWLL